MLWAVVCLFCLSVTLVYCGQTVGWSKIALGTEVGIGPDDIVLDVDPAPSPTERDTAAPTFRLMSIDLWPNGRPSQQLLSSCLIIVDNLCSPVSNRTGSNEKQEILTNLTK